MCPRHSDGEFDPESTFQLLERARTGDQAAVERLFARHLEPLQRWASGRLPRWARDLASNGLSTKTNFSLAELGEPIHFES